MAWARRTANDLGTQYEVTTLPSSAAQEFGSVIDFLKPRCDGTTQYITFIFLPTAVTGTNLDIALYGSTDSAGTSKYLLKDIVVADLTVDAMAVAGKIDINAYPAPYYFIAWTADADEHLNTITVDIVPEFPQG